MKKKVIGFITLLLVLLLGLSIDTYAFSNYTEFENDLVAKLNILKTNSVIATNFSYNNIGTPYSGYYDYILMLRSSDKQTNGTYSKIFIGYWNRSKHNPIVNAGYNNCWGFNDYFVQVKGFNTQTGAVTDSANAYALRTWSFDYVYTSIAIDTSNMTLGEGEEYGQYYITEPPVSIVFNDYSDGTITVNYNNMSESFLKYCLSRSVNSWALGRVEGLSGDKKVDARLSIFIPGTENYTTTLGHAQWYGGVMTSSGGLSFTGDGTLYINNSNVYYEQGYNLSLDLDGENVGNFYIYFLPYGSNQTSGDLFNPDIDTNQYVDLIQNLQDLIALGTVDEIYDDNFGNSGDSGDVILSTLDYKPYNNDYSSYMQTCFESLYEVISGSGDVSFSFNFMGTSMTVHSNDFTVPNNPLKAFVTTFLVFATIYYFYVQCSHFYHKLQEGDFEGATETLAVNDESVLM